MKRFVWVIVLPALVTACSLTAFAAKKDYWNEETEKERSKRMEWWREARFGMFIHWGLYAVPAGEWNGKTGYAEWIKRQAEIPKETYDKFVDQFNPVKFDAEAWVKMAKDAGMKYIVITSKHHDGFCLWPSEVSDYDIEETPYKKDILKALTDACKKYDVRMCFYHSIMDWHHPHYMPKHSWDPGTNPADGEPVFSKYVDYMKAQLKELVDRYDPGVMWFDGEWESSWTHEMGVELYQYMRELNEDIIVNNRVDKGRRGMLGLTKSDQYRGDFGTPEQQIPAQGLPGVDWESCMTMSSKWGWNKSDTRWKSSADLIRKLVDIASKGGNFLLNIGPKPDGTFPEEAVERLADIGRWMDVNGEAIYETAASPCKRPSWGRITRKQDGEYTILYLHVFDWKDGCEIPVDVSNKVKACGLLADSDRKLPVMQDEMGIRVKLAGEAPDQICSVIKLEIEGKPVVTDELKKSICGQPEG